MATKKSKRNNRKKNKSQLSPLGIILCVIVALSAVAYDRCDGADGSGRLTTTLPESTRLMEVIIPENVPNTPVVYDGMSLSFNPVKHVPNWVAWELTADETVGTVSRKDKFQADPNVAGCAEDYDYLYSGYDRGHMAPAGDMKWSSKAMEQTFYLTNICPQAHSLNSGAWKRLEEKCRTWAKADSAIIIVCGPVLTDNIRDYLGDNRVAVPKRFFKVILSPYTNPPRAIGFVMNNGSVSGGLQQTAVSVDEVERITGFDFFSALPDSVEDMIEARCDFNLWSNIKVRK